MEKSVNKLLFGILFVIVIFNNVLSGWIPFLGYLDEITALVSIVYILIHFKKVFARRYNQMIIVLFSLAALIGVIGNVLYGYQTALIAILKDILAYYKMPVTFIALYHWSENRDLFDAHVVATKLSKLFTVIIFIGCIINFFADVGFSHDIRYGFKSYKFLCTHPTFLVYALVLISVVLVSDQQDRKRQTRRYWFYYLQIIISLLFTFRDKAFGYITLFVILMVLLPRAKKIKLRYFFVAAIIAFFISYNKLMEYQSWSWSPREALYVNGFQLTRIVFPWGSGFGTFNSFLSGEYYSKAYYLFGLEKKLGMNAINYADLGDAQLPYYYTQFGIIGFILICIAIIQIINCVKARYAGMKMKSRAAYLLLGYMAIAMLVEAVFTNQSGVTFVLIMLLYLDTGKSSFELAKKET